MGLAHSPRIVTNGLVLCLDAGNTKSYPGSGTTWTDLSGRGNHGTLTNGPTFSSANKGSIVFDGVDDYVNTNYIFSNSAASISVWFKALTQTSTSGSSLRPIVQQGDFTGFALPEGVEINMISNAFADAGKIRFSWGNGTNATHFLLSNNRYDDNTWYLATLSNNGTTFDIYINTTLLSTKSTYTSVSTATSLQLGGSSTVGARKFLGSIAQVSIYNRALSAAEIQQNFNALRGRFGI